MYRGKLFLFIFSLLIASNVIADDLYQIELMVVENKYVGKENEYWSSYTGTLDLTNTQQLLQGSQQTNDQEVLIALPIEKYQLLKIADNIKRSRYYKLIYHVAWQQPLKQNSNNKSVYVHETDNINNDDQSSIPAFAGVLSVKPIRGSFYTTVDFIFNKHSYFQETIKFRLNDTGLLKQKELYYFDHPLFGLFVMITPTYSENFID